MRFVLSAAATLAAIGISSAAPAPRNAPAPAPAPAPVAEPAPAPVQYSAPAPSYAAPSSSESEASRAPLAPVSDSIHFSNPARNYSIQEILETPHRWYGRDAAAIQASMADTTAVGIAVLNPLFVAFRNEDADNTLEANPYGLAKPNGLSDGRIAVGFMTPAWGAGVDLAFFRLAQDPVNRDSSMSASYGMDRIGVFGSLPYGNASIYGRADWVTDTLGSWSADDNSSRDWNYDLKVGYRTYIEGAEGTAYDASLRYAMRYIRLSGWEDPVYVNDLVLAFDYGTRRTVDRVQFLWGSNSFFEYGDSKYDPDYFFALGTQPNFSLEIPVFNNWTLKGGAGMMIQYWIVDHNAGDASDIDRGLWTLQPGAALGLRYARGRWAAEAEATNLITRGPWFATGGPASPLGRFAITCDFGR